MSGKRKRKKEDKRKYKIGEVKEISAPNFLMNPAELHAFLPFEEFTIRRVYWLTEPKNEMKSSTHAHSNDENEMFIMIQGKAMIVLDDDGKGRRKVKVKKNNIIWVPRMVWHGYEDMSKDCIILALTTTNYDPDRKGYIEDYQEFKKALKKEK